jgi:phage N-6-adenine-methyltransferase
MFSSDTDDWATPIDFFKKLDLKYKFTLDVCASEKNHKAPLFFDREQNGLIQNWGGQVCWMNPPYGREIGLWMRKAYESAKQPNTVVVCLVPARTDTAWWHDFAVKGEITFIRGRLRFGDGKGTAPFPSAVVVFDFRRQIQTFGILK